MDLANEPGRSLPLLIATLDDTKLIVTSLSPALESTNVELEPSSSVKKLLPFASGSGYLKTALLINIISLKVSVV